MQHHDQQLSWWFHLQCSRAKGVLKPSQRGDQKGINSTTSVPLYSTALAAALPTCCLQHTASAVDPGHQCTVLIPASWATWRSCPTRCTEYTRATYSSSELKAAT